MTTHWEKELSRFMQNRKTITLLCTISVLSVSYIYFWQNVTDNILSLDIIMLSSVGKYNFCSELKHEQYFNTNIQHYGGWGRGAYKEVLCHDPSRRNKSARVTSQLNSLLMSMSSIKLVPDVFVTLSFILGLLKWKYLKTKYFKDVSYICSWLDLFHTLQCLPFL